MQRVKPPPFDYAPRRVARGAVALLAERGEDAKTLAGGQSLVPAAEHARRASVPARRREPHRGPGRHRPRERRGCASAPRVRQRRSAAARACPLLAECLRHVGHVATRNRGTVGGSIAHARRGRRAAARARRARRIRRHGLAARPARDPGRGLLRDALHDRARARTRSRRDASGRVRGRGRLRLRGARAAPRRLRARHGRCARSTAASARRRRPSAPSRSTARPLVEVDRRASRRARPGAPRARRAAGELHASADVPAPPRPACSSSARCRAGQTGGRVIPSPSRSTAAVSARRSSRGCSSRTSCATRSA